MTAFHFRLHPLPNPILGGVWLYPPPSAARVIKAFRDFMETAPEELGGGVVFTTAPDAPFVPELARGRPIVLLNLLYAGEPVAGERVLAPLKEAIPPVGDLVQATPYLEFQKTGVNHPGIQNYWTADFLKELPDEAVDAYAALAMGPLLMTSM